MQISVNITRSDVESIANVLNADACGIGYSSTDGDCRDRVCSQLILRATIVHNIITTATARVCAREHARHSRSTRPRS